MPKFNISTHFHLKHNDQKRILKPSGFWYFRGVFQSATYFRGGGSEMCEKVWQGREGVKVGQK